MGRTPFSSRRRDQDEPAARRLDFERHLCNAIRDRNLVRIRYKDDAADRLIAPYAVYTSSKDKVLLAGTQINNPGQPLDAWEPRNLEVGLMRSVTLTDTKFEPDTRFDPSDPRYKNGFVCRL